VSLITHYVSVHPHSETAIAAMQSGLSGIELVVDFVHRKHMITCENILRDQGILVDEEDAEEEEEAEVGEENDV
jgi:hypothetical protein